MTTTLVIDIGGSDLKASVLDNAGAMLTERVVHPTRYPCAPVGLVAQLAELAAALPSFDRISVGFPGVVRQGLIVTAPHFVSAQGPGGVLDPDLEGAWGSFDLAGALGAELGRPARVINDADLQGVGLHRGRGVEVIMTLGTGVGTCVFEDSRLGPHLELAHHPLHGGQTYNQYLGESARARIGNEEWNARVRHAIVTLDRLFVFDHLYVGGGNTRHIVGALPPDVTIVDPNAALLAGVKLWDAPR